MNYMKLVDRMRAFEADSKNNANARWVVMGERQALEWAEAAWALASDAGQLAWLGMHLTIVEARAAATFEAWTRAC